MMKNFIYILILLCSSWNYGMGQINFQGCPVEFGATTYVLAPIGTTNDGGTIRNTYDTSPIDGAQPCNGLGFGFCEFRIIWDVAANEWLFQITDGASFFTIYRNSSPSAPNPPDLTLGTWVENTANTTGNCGGALTTSNSTLSGDVQSSIGGCTNPTIPTITSTPTSVCAGGTVTLNISGTLNDATNWHVYTGSCGGTQVGMTSGSSLVVSPSSPSTTYFVRGEDGLGCVDEATGACGMTTVTVTPITSTPTISTSGPTTFCTGGSVTLTSSASSGNQWLLNNSPIGGATSQTLVVTAAGNYSVLANTTGCVSNASLVRTVTINSTPSTPTTSASGPTTFCSGGSVTLTSSAASGNQWLLNGTPIGGATNQTLVVTTTGNYTVEVTMNGCTSNPSLGIGVTGNSNPPTPAITSGGPTTFCAGGSVTLSSTAPFGNQWFLNNNPIGGATDTTFVATATGNYRVEMTMNGCISSSATIAVTVNPIPATPTITAGGATTFCTGASVTLSSSAASGNQWFLNGSPIGGATSQTLVVTSTGTYSVVETTNGCPSATSGNVAILVNSPVANSQTLVECAGFSITIGPNTYTTSGTYMDTLTANNGCDSIITTDLTVLSALSSTLTQTICAGDSITVNGTVYNSTVVGATEVFTNVGANNCDSTVTINLTVLPALSSTLTQTICAGDSITVNGTVYNSTVVGATEVFINVGANNCDSTLTINLTVLPALSSTLTQTICAGDSIVVNGTVYNSTVVGATEVFTNVGANNCDSTVTINLTVLPALSSTLTQTICAGDSITVNGTVYNSTVVGATEVFTNVGANNCDSTVTINLTVLPALSSTLTQTICAGDSITVNGTVYNSTVVGATEVFTNVGANNCDSTVTINLTVLNPVDTSITTNLPTLTANAATASYQWVNCDSSYAPIAGATAQVYTPTMNGNYAVIITEGTCSDTSSCYNVIISGIKNTKLTQMITLYPNPTSGNLSIELGQFFNEITITVTSITGQHLSTKSFQSTDKVDLNIDGASGVYLLKVITDKGDTATIKVLKN